MDKLVIFGTGRYAGEMYSLCQKYALFDVLGFMVDREYLKNTEYFGKSVYPSDDIEKFVDVNDTLFFVAIDWIQRLNKYKRQKYEELKQKGYKFANIISPNASVNYKLIGDGNYIDDNVYIAHDVVIGSNNNFRPYAYVTHDGSIGNHNHFGDHCCLAGSVRVGNQNYFGVNCTVFNSLSIGDKNIIGGGSVVKRSLKDNCMCVAPDPFVKHCEDNEIEDYLDYHRMHKVDKMFY